MSGIMLNILAASVGGGAPVGYLAALTNPNGTAVQRGILAMRDDVLAVTCATVTGAGVNQLTVLKLTLDAEIVWQTLISDGADGPRPNNLHIDSAGGVVVVGDQFVSFNNFRMAFVAKFNSSGVLQWQRRILGNSSFNAVAIDSSDDIYCAGEGRLFSASLTDAYMAKYDAAGAIQYRRNIGDTGGGGTRQETAFDIAVDVNNFLIAGAADDANRDAALFLCAKSTGNTVNLSLQKDALNAGYQQGAAIVAGEANGIFYYAVQTHVNTSPISKASQIISRQVTGVGVTWSTRLEASGSLSIVVSNLCMDSDHTHVYVSAGVSNASGLFGVQLSKFDAATGDLVWQRSLFPSAGSIIANSIQVDSLDNMYVSFTSEFNGVTSPFILKMPGSGAGTGNSVPFGGRTYTYAATAHAVTSSFLTVVASTLPNQLFTQSSIVTTATEAASTLTITDEAL